jgi:tRNA (guanine-N7-)-methyltransferase
MAAEDFIIAKKRKKYRFAKFAEASNCFEADNWQMPKVSKPITLELGAGTGLFGVELARRHPERFFIACDVKADRLQKGAWAALEAGLDNIIFLRAHGTKLTDMLPARRLSEIWITFPDPHPKNRSTKHRLTNRTFLQQYRKLLTSDGMVYFKTDNTPLFCWSLEQFVGDHWQFKTLSFDLHNTDLPDDYKIMTTYETKFTAEGLPTQLVVAKPL